MFRGSIVMYWSIALHVLKDIGRALIIGKLAAKDAGPVHIQISRVMVKQIPSFISVGWESLRE